jgi:hypothetical protein
MLVACDYNCRSAYHFACVACTAGLQQHKHNCTLSLIDEYVALPPLIDIMPTFSPTSTYALHTHAPLFSARAHTMH